jgi:hypothetical protein
MNAVNGKPMKAFIYQDQDAHIAAHQAFMTDPVVMKTLGQNPQANQIMAALQAHMAEHLGFQYRSQIEKQLGVTLPEPDKPLPASVEVQLSRLVATASQQLLEIHKGQAAQQKAQEQQQDPLIQLQQQNCKSNKQDAQRKCKKMQQIHRQRLLKLRQSAMRIQQQAQTEQMKIQAEAERHAIESQEKMALEKLRLGVDVAKEDARINKGNT